MNIVDVAVMRDWTLPLFPMRPCDGSKLTKKFAQRILEEQEQYTWIFQPKLSGDRVLLAVTDRKVLVANRYYEWYQHRIDNADNFLKMGNASLFDGMVHAGRFYPFECLAFDGRSLKPNTAEERILIAEQMCKICGVAWLFPKPTKKWLLAGRANLPRYEGIVRKRARFHYIPQTNSSGTSAGWVTHCW